jgi:hypothetical protein
LATFVDIDLRTACSAIYFGAPSRKNGLETRRLLRRPVSVKLFVARDEIVRCQNVGKSSSVLLTMWTAVVMTWMTWETRNRQFQAYHYIVYVSALPHVVQWNRFTET